MFYINFYFISRYNHHKTQNHYYFFNSLPPFFPHGKFSQTPSSNLAVTRLILKFLGERWLLECKASGGGSSTWPLLPGWLQLSWKKWLKCFSPFFSPLVYLKLCFSSGTDLTFFFFLPLDGENSTNFNIYGPFKAHLWKFGDLLHCHLEENKNQRH